MINTPTLSSFKSWLGLSEDDVEDDQVLQASLDAAIEQQCLVVVYPVDAFGDATFTPDLITACYLSAQRLAARRNSPESVIGLSGTGGDFVGARIPGLDPDVARLQAPYTPVVSA